MRKLILIITMTLSISITDAQETITIQANQQLDTTTKFMQGFLHGGALYVDSVAVSKLKPAFWRIGAYWLAGSDYAATKRFNPKITVNINDLYMIVNGITSQTLSHPWTGGWNGWDSIVNAVVNQSIINNQPVDFWDLWGEPDEFWTGTTPEWIEMYRRTDSIINSIDPNAKITGPEFAFAYCNFDVAPILWFLDTLYSVGAQVDGVSWHNLCNNPENVPAQVQQLRDSLAVRPWLGNLTLHIPEYASPQNSTIPGWNLGWIYYLEKAKLDWVSHSCWNESDGVNSWSNCEYGLNGLFMQDNVTPQPNYWVHRAYAELDSLRLITNSSHIKTVALASNNNTSQETKVIIGRYDNPNLGSHNASADVEIKIKNYPYCSNCSMPLVIQRIPSNNVPYSVPLNSPITTFTGTVTFTGDSASVFINGFVDGDAYIIYINPSANSLLAINEQIAIDNNFQIFPNPSTGVLNINLPVNQESQFQIYNSMGILVREFSITQSSQISVADLSSGLYFVYKTNHPQQTLKFIKQ